MTFEVGGYRAIEMIGVGASAQVWSGMRISDGVRVAMKMFPADRIAVPQREAALTAAVNHPHVVAVLDVVGDTERAALITELAVGGDLADLLARRGRLTGAETLTVLLPLAAALATAHERQIVHGDLSAENILFDRAGRPLLADLGAGRAAAELGLPVAATPVDAAPELARGGPPTPETDMFSLGSVALACLTGRHAWPAEDLRDVLIQAAAGQWPDPGDDAEPPGLVTAIRGLLEHDPDRRPGAASLAVDLRAVGRPEPIDLALGSGIQGTDASPHSPDGRSVSVGRHFLDESPPGRLGGIAPPTSPMSPAEASSEEETEGSARLVRARAVTRLRSDAAPRLAPASAARGWGRRIRRAVSVRPPLSTRSPGQLIRISLLGLACLLIAALAGTAGLWWAGLDRREPVALNAGRSQSTTQVFSGQLPSATSGTATSRGAPAPSVATRAAMGSSSDAQKSAGPSAGAHSAAPVVPVPNWTATVRVLDEARAKALVTRDAALLDAVYTPGSAARSADAKVISALLDGHLRVTGAAHLVQMAQKLAGSSIRLAVRDSMPSYPILDAVGKVVGKTVPRGSAARVLVLVATTGGYRISQVESA